MQDLGHELTKTREQLLAEGGRFWASTGQASKVFFDETRQAAEQLALGIAEQGKLLGSFGARVGRETATTGAAAWSAPRLRQRFWVALAGLLERLQRQAADKAQQAPAAVTDCADTGLADYGTLTAKTIVASLPDLSDDQCRAVLSLEQQTKSRTTVLRALEARIAA
jgi:hypothetical protein